MLFLRNVEEQFSAFAKSIFKKLRISTQLNKQTHVIIQKRPLEESQILSVSTYSVTKKHILSVSHVSKSLMILGWS